MLDPSQVAVCGYAIGSGGTLKLLLQDGIVAPQPPTPGDIDVVVGPDNKYLFVLDSMGGQLPGEIAGFSIASSLPWDPLGLLFAGK